MNTVYLSQETMQHNSQVSKHQPTVVVIASAGWTVSRFLRGGFLDRLVRSSQVVVLTPQAGDTEFVAHLQRSGVSRVEPLPRFVPTEGYKKAFARLNLAFWSWINTAAVQHKRRWMLETMSPLRRAVNRVRFAWNRCRASPQRISALRAEVQRQFFVDGLNKPYLSLLEPIRPSVVFSPIPIHEEEVAVALAAHQMGIPVVASIASWDNLASKMCVPLDFDRYYLWSDLMRDDLLRFYPDVSLEQVEITGTPQFDDHRNSALLVSRDEFCRRMGLDPSRPIVLYADCTPSLMPHEERVVEALADALDDDHAGSRCQLLVRLHPKDDGARFGALAGRRGVSLRVPGAESSGDIRAWRPDDEYQREFVNTLHHCDVHVNYFSTMVLDAAVVDRPVICPVFEYRRPGERPARVLRMLEYEHLQPVLKSGGVRLAHSLDELVGEIHRYLEDPARDAEGRRRIVEQVCGAVDGRAGERIAACIMEMAQPQVGVCA